MVSLLFSTGTHIDSERCFFENHPKQEIMHNVYHYWIVSFYNTLSRRSLKVDELRINFTLWPSVRSVNDCRRMYDWLLSTAKTASKQFPLGTFQLMDLFRNRNISYGMRYPICFDRYNLSDDSQCKIDPNHRWWFVIPFLSDEHQLEQKWRRKFRHGSWNFVDLFKSDFAEAGYSSNKIIILYAYKQRWPPSSIPKQSVSTNNRSVQTLLVNFPFTRSESWHS